MNFTGPITEETVYFSIYLPPGYNRTDNRYPVIYHLHGLKGSYNSYQIDTVPESFEKSLNLGTVGPSIIVFPDGYGNSMWADSSDMTKPAETNVVHELIPYIDSHYRTWARRDYRVVEGMSMGGFGAAKFISKFPDLFCGGVIYDGGLYTWNQLKIIHPDNASEIFDNNEDYFNQYSPWYWADQNSGQFLSGTHFRQVVGKFVNLNENYRDYLQNLNISDDFVETGCGHDLFCLLDAEGDNSWAFITARYPLPAGWDYDGDGTSDIAIFRGTSGLWAIRGITRVYFGSADDLPVPGDYDGNSTTDIGIFRSSLGLWAIRGVTRSYFGSSSDTAVPGDYNGDGECDMGIFRDTSGLWAIRGITRAYFGGSSDSPAPGYYNGDSTKDIGIFREDPGLWAIKGISRVYFGSPGDETVPGDYDGDGAWDYGIFRGSSGLWAIRGVTRSYFGSSSDSPVPGDYDGTGSDNIGIFRETSGLWAIREVSRIYFGGPGDLPVTR